MQTLKNFHPTDNANLFSNDKGLQDILSFLVTDAEKDRLFSILQNWQKNIPQWERLATEASRPEKLPRVEKYDHVGRRIEKVVLPLETQTVRKQVVEQGIWQNQTEVEKFAKILLLAQIGESGVTCPLACTDGLVRSIGTIGDDFLKQNYLPQLTSAETPLAGAQFVTEQSGGSDVGAIEGVATKNDDGSYHLTAEKWYCSAIDEFFLVAARPEGAPQGTEGIAIFFVPRTLTQDGQTQPNNLSIRRLKDKLGTQSLPTAEVDFQDAKAWAIGDPAQGFASLMNYILNVSRVHNAANCLGLHQRAFVEARNYATQRKAFGKSLIEFPLIQEYLLSIQSSLTSSRNLFFNLVQTLDDKGLLPEDNEQRLWQRFLINLMKYRTAVPLTDKVKEAILVFGANGIVQDFSIVPRLLRDALIVETWEGPHNTLCLQIMRDSTRFDLWGRFQNEVKEILDVWDDKLLQSSRKVYSYRLTRMMEMLTPDKLSDKNWVQTHAKRLVNFLGDFLEIGLLIRQGIAQNNQAALVMASYLTHQKMSDSLSDFHNPVLQGLKDFGLDIINENNLDLDLENF